MWTAARVATRILTVSEASKRDILRFFDVPPRQDRRHLQRHRRAVPRRADRRRDACACRERYQLHGDFVLYAGNVKPHKNLERLIDAFHLLRQSGLDHLKLVVIGDEISKYAALRRAVHRYNLHKHVRFLGYMPDETLAVLYRLAAVFVFPVALRRLRPAAARSDGERHAGRHVERVVAAGGGRRRGGAGRSDAIRRRSPTASARVLTDPALRADLRARGLARARQFSWERVGRGRFATIYGEVAGEALMRDRAGARLADRHARRREGARSAVRALPGRRSLHAGPRPGIRVAGDRAAPDSHVGRAAAARRRAGLPALPAASSRRRSSSSTSTATTSSSAPATARPRRSWRPGAPGTSATASRRCGTPGTSSTRISARRGWAAAGSAAMPAGAARGWPGGTAPRPAASDRYVAISHYVAGRIRRYYNREAQWCTRPWTPAFYSPDGRPPEALRPGGVCAGPVQAHRPGHRGRPARRHAARRSWATGPERARLLSARDAPAPMCSSWDASPTRRSGTCIGAPRPWCCRARRTSASCPWRRRPAAGPSWRSAGAARSRRWSPGDHGRARRRADSRGVRRRRLPTAAAHRFDTAAIRAPRRAIQPRALRRRDARRRRPRRWRAAGRAMVKRHNRLLVAFYVLSDAVLGIAAFLLAYADPVRDRPHPRHEGLPAVQQYVNVLPFIGVLVPFAFHVQGLYRLRRGRSRVDDFFAVFVGSILAVVFGDRRHAVLPGVLRSRRAEGPRRVRGLAARVGVLPRLQRDADVRVARARARGARAAVARGHRAQADPHRGRRRARPARRRQDPRAPRAGLPDRRLRGRPRRRRLPRLPRAAAARHARRGRRDRAARGVDHLYVALPAEEHVRMLQLLEAIGREMVDVKVVPDLLQVIALQARLEDLDGIPIININDVPLQGFNSVLKRAHRRRDCRRRRCSLLAIPFGHRARDHPADVVAARSSTGRSGWASTASRS